MEKQGSILEDKIEEKLQDSAKKRIDFRWILTLCMGIFVIFVMCWGIYQLIYNIDSQKQSVDQTVTDQTENNEKNAGKSLDADTLINDLLEQVEFETELSLLDDSVAEGMITTESGTKLQVYMGNGSYADEIVVMTAKNENDAKKNQENAKVHLDEMKKMFQDYIPKEAKKIEDAVRVRCGCYVIMCVTSDTDTAKEVIDAAIKE